MAEHDLSDGVRVDDNLVLDSSGVVRCSHCGAEVGSRSQPTSAALLREGPPTLAGPQILGNPAAVTDRPIVFRQLLCPGCFVSIQAEIAPADEVSHRGRSL